MPEKNRVLQVFVIGIFIILISGFVAYRSGIFGKNISGAAEFADPVVNGLDTLPPPDDSAKPRRMMSGSKSMILIDNKPDKDSAIKKIAKDSTASGTGILPSSKSGIIIRPKDIKSDADSVKKKDSIIKPRTILPSSKSGMMIRPAGNN
jgi:hypothetical protein